MSNLCSIGIGAGSAATIDETLALLARVVGVIEPNGILATLEQHEPLARAIATRLQLRIALFAAHELRAITGITAHSSFAERRVGTPSVAEAAALAALGPNARLRITKQRGLHCTCAVAEIAP